MLQRPAIEVPHTDFKEKDPLRHIPIYSASHYSHFKPHPSFAIVSNTLRFFFATFSTRPRKVGERDNAFQANERTRHGENFAPRGSGSVFFLPPTGEEEAP